MDDKTKQEIWETFKDKFIEEGISLPEQLIIRNSFPNEEEVKKNYGLLKKLGKFRNGCVWIMKTSVKVAGAIVIIAALPDACQKISTWHPKAFEYVKSVKQSVDKYYDSEKLEVLEAQGKYSGTYIVLNDKWENDEHLFLHDVDDLNNKGIISDNTMLVPGSAVGHIVDDYTDMTAMSSDLTA